MNSFYATTHKCLICNEKFQKLREWREHIFNVHPENLYINLILKDYGADVKKDPFAWKTLRKLIIQRDNYTCKLCKERPGIYRFFGRYRPDMHRSLSNPPTLHIHHRKYVSVKNKDLIALCEKCHGKMKKEKNG